MSGQVLKEAIAAGKILCPRCGKAVREFEKFADAPGAAGVAVGADGEPVSKVTLICGNGGCSWYERTEYWDELIT